jgi:DNA primase
MNILDLAHELQLVPKRSSSTNGGEYKSKCPKCQGGKDRFCIWPNQGDSGRYWCRVCDAKGDGIQFCRDFLGMSFHGACQKVQVIPRVKAMAAVTKIFKAEVFSPHESSPVDQSWQKAAKSFVDRSHARLLNEPEAIEFLLKRGINLDTIKKFSLGWNSGDLFDERATWGMVHEIKENGQLKRLWLPKGIVIPSYSNDGDPNCSLLFKIKVRRDNWYNGDSFPKYVEVSGSEQSLSIYGDRSRPVMIVESELDAILIQQEASQLVCCLALGGVGKKPDAVTHAWLKRSRLILLSLDFDDVAKKRCAFWMKLYSNLKLWPCPCAKSPGDAYEVYNVNIFNWVRSGMFF